MASNFDQAVEVILAHEGGLVRNPNDPGGLTNFGISMRFAKNNLNGSHFGRGDGPVNDLDIINMTREEAKKIYFDFWWNKQGYGKIDDQRLATKVFDMSVNMGPVQAHKLVQRAANFFNSDVIDDGQFGPRTISSLNSNPIDQMLLQIISQQKAFYQHIVAASPTKQEFLKGWLKRASWPF